MKMVRMRILQIFQMQGMYIIDTKPTLEFGFKYCTNISQLIRQ